MGKSTRLLLALVLGAGAGALLHPFADRPWMQFVAEHVLSPFGQIFLRLLFATVVPLVFSALVLGVFELGGGRGIGRIASKTLVYTIVASSISVLVGIVLVNLFKPGVGFQIDPAMISSQEKSILSATQNAAEAKTFSQALVDLIPKNPIDAASRALQGEMLSLMVYALIFGVALVFVVKEGREENVLVKLLENIFAISMKMIDFAFMIAPIGVFAIIFNTVFKFGADILGSLALYVLVVVAGLLIQQFGVYSLLLRVIAKRSPMEFFRGIKDVMIYAFSTSSSNATLPLALETAELKLRLPPQISRFVLTVGATANQNGTALFEGITVLFLAQVYGIELSLGQQVQVVLMSILAGIGTAGVPGGSLPMIVLLLQSVGVPAEGIGLVLGVDRFLDMCRTTLNVTGDLVITTMVSAGEGSAKNA